MKDIKRKSSKNMAVILLDSEKLEMKIGQAAKGTVTLLDTLTVPLELELQNAERYGLAAHDFQNLNEAIDGFSQILKEYDIQKTYCYYSKEFINIPDSRYLFGQLNERIGVHFEPLDDIFERTVLMCQTLRHIPRDLLAQQNQDGLMVLLGENESSIARLSEMQIRLTRGVPLSLREIRKLRNEAEESVENFGDVISEYIGSLFSEAVISSKYREYSYVLAHGSQVSAAVKVAGGTLLKEGILSIDTDTLHSVVSMIRNLSPEKISEKLHINQSKVIGVYSVLLILDCVMRRTEAEKLFVSNGDFVQDLMELELLPKGETVLEDHIRQAAIGGAWELAITFRCDQKHATFVNESACRLFDRLKRFHGLEKNWKTYLTIAVYLHDCGIFVGEKGHEASGHIISGLPLYGLTEDERKRVADLLSMQPSELNVERLRALFLLADALDVSRNKKLSLPEIRIEGDKVVIQVQSDENVFLEKRAFDEAARYFKQVYGLQAILTVHNTLLK